MNLDETQKKKVAGWVAEGLKLADIQSRLNAEFKLNLTYMETRFLVDDLKLVPKDTERPKEPTSPLVAAPPGEGPPANAPAGTAKPGAAAGAGAPGGQPGGVTLSVDTVTRAGALVSGTVRFSDGQSAAWYMDQYGRLGMVPQQQGYKPGPADVEEFQKALERELTRLGL